MAFNAAGTWTPEDDDVGAQVSKTIAQGGPLMKAAKGMGAALANKRGLANSSMAVGAAQGEVLKAATPIASQTAAQTAQKNLAALQANENLRYGTTMQQMQDDAAKDRLGMQIGSTEKLTGLELTSREKISGNEIASQEKMQGSQIASTEKLSANEIAARMSELNTKIGADIKLAQMGDQAAMARLEKDLASREVLAKLEAQTQQSIASGNNATTLKAAEMQIGGNLLLQREKIAADASLSAAEREAELAKIDKQIQGNLQLQVTSDAGAFARQQAADTSALERQREELQFRTDLSAQERQFEMERLDKDIAARKELGAMEIEANSKNAALGAASNATQSYMNALSATMNNDKMPASARANYEAALKAANQASLKLVEQMTGQTLSWG